MNQLMTFSKSFLRAAIASCVLSCAVIAPIAQADDTEIFFGQSNDAFETNPNILFVLDISGSMTNRDSGSVSRLDRMKNAMRLLLDQSTNFNVGIMAFQGGNGGASVRYPIGDLDGDSSELCPDGICPDETVVVRPGNGSDDAVQNDESNIVTLDGDNLVMGLVTQATIDGVNGVVETPTAGVPITGPSTTSTTKSVTVTSSVQEAVHLVSDNYKWDNDLLTENWFHRNDQHRETLIGYRFEGVEIPPGALVTSASVTFHLTAETNQIGEMAAYIAAEQTAAPMLYPLSTSGGDVTTENTLIERNDITSRTNEIVAWTAIPGTVENPADIGNVITTPDLSAILNELVNLPAWASGNAVSLLVSPQDSYSGSTGIQRQVYGTGALLANRPVLTFTYEELAEETVQTTLSTSISHIDEFLVQNDQTVHRNELNTTSSLFHVGAGIEPRKLALRFPNIDIPKGATITSANLTLRTFDGVIADDPTTSWPETSALIPDTPSSVTGPINSGSNAVASGVVDPSSIPAGVVDPSSPPAGVIEPDPTPAGVIEPAPPPAGIVEPDPTPAGVIDPATTPAGVVGPVTNPSGVISPTSPPEGLVGPVNGSNLSATVTSPTTNTPVDPKFNINVNAELTATPVADNLSYFNLSGPEITTDFISWSDVPMTNNTDIVSPNLVTVIDEVLALDTWVSGNTLSLILSPGEYDDIPTNILRVLTGQSAFKPTLDIRWTAPVNTTESAPISHTTAIRFRNVHVPPGATIKSAQITMHAAAVNGEEASFDIAGEKAANSAPYATTDNDIGGRQRTTARETWPLTSWDAVGNDYTTADVTSIVSEITNQSDWCGGNALSVFIKGSGNRFAKSVEANPTEAPTLQIVYAPESVPTGGYCSNSSLVIAAADGVDDAVENTNDGQLALSNDYLSTNRGEGSTDPHVIGLRFRGLQLPPGASITSATIEMTAAADMPDATNVAISVQSSSDAGPYLLSDASSNIQARSYGTPVNWQQPGGSVIGDNLFSSDVTSLIDETINRAGWQAGNSIAFKMEATSGSLDIMSRDGDESSSPRLIVYYQAERDAPGTQNRAQIQQTVDELVAVGATPIVESLWEASNYLRGENVDYGVRRGTDYRYRRWYRISHSGSYEGGRVYRPRGCNNGDLNDWDCAHEAIWTTPTTPVYKSPITSQCQSNHIVLLSDGAATSNNAIDRIETRISQDGPVSCSTAHPYSDRCGRELAAWMKNNDHSDEFTGEQKITTHTIGFNLDDPTLLQGIATSGGGIFEPASSASELLLAFKKIFNNVSQRNASFVSPGATVSQFNRLRNRTDVYYAMFKPSGTARWSGNLKRYEMSVDENNDFVLRDSRGNLAINETAGTFHPNARSYWSTKIDGDDVQVGGAAEQIQLANPSFTNRKVYTYTGTTPDLTDPSNDFSSTNTNLDQTLLSLPPTVTSDPDKIREIIDWARGKDLFDNDGDGDKNEARDHMGDPMHSVPLIANYDNGESVIYMATNEGFLHAVDTDDGHEHFAFIPKELLKNVYKFYRNDSTRNRPYGLDGGKMMWHDDTDQDGLIDATETAILYVGMRRGGDSYYAIDVSSYTEPRYLWSIKGGVRTQDDDLTTANGDYEELGSTWSLPVKTKILDGSTERDVIVFGGGYDPNQDPASESVVVVDASGAAVPTPDQTRTTDSIGRGIFIADALTGELVWKTSLNANDFSDMQYSIPSQLRVLDIDFDGLVDQIYVGDMGGQIWRMDFDNKELPSESIDNRIDAGVIAKLAGDTPESNRKFYYPPDVAVVRTDGRQMLNIAIGSGWRAHPLDDLVEDRFYSLRSPYVYGPPIDSFGVLNYVPVYETGMVDVTDDLSPSIDGSSNGWFIRMTRSGEKILSSSLTFNSQILFTTYLPARDTDACDAAIGSGSLYGLSIHDGSPIENLDGVGDDENLTIPDRSLLLSNAGLPPEVSILFPDIDTTTKPAVQVGKETKNEFDSGPTSQTTFWQEVSESHD